MSNAYHDTRHPVTLATLDPTNLKPHSDEVQHAAPVNLGLFHASTQSVDDDTQSGDDNIPSPILDPDYWMVCWRCCYQRTNCQC